MKMLPIVLMTAFAFPLIINAESWPEPLESQLAPFDDDPGEFLVPASEPVYVQPQSYNYFHQKYFVKPNYFAGEENTPSALLRDVPIPLDPRAVYRGPETYGEETVQFFHPQPERHFPEPPPRVQPAIRYKPVEPVYENPPVYIASAVQPHSTPVKTHQPLSLPIKDTADVPKFSMVYRIPTPYVKIIRYLPFIPSEDEKESLDLKIHTFFRQQHNRNQDVKPTPNQNANPLFLYYDIPKSYNSNVTVAKVIGHH